jgi:hypothetical protein
MALRLPHRAHQQAKVFVSFFKKALSCCGRVSLNGAWYKACCMLTLGGFAGAIPE